MVKNQGCKEGYCGSEMVVRIAVGKHLMKEESLPI